MPADSRPEKEPDSGTDRVAAFLKTGNMLRFFDYWRSKRPGRGLPSRADIDPIDIPWALPWTFLMDFEQPDVFRYRLAGQELADVFGRNLKGCTLEDVLPPGALPGVTERWMPLVDRRAVICMRGLVYKAKERLPVGERIMLPLSDTPEGPVTGLFGMTVYSWVQPEAIDQTVPPEVLTVPADEID